MNLADKIVMCAVDALIPYASNSRTHTPEQIVQIAASIREFGFTNPVLVDGKQGIIAGHGRVLAARKLGMDQIPTIELAYLSETQRKAYILADNKVAENAKPDKIVALYLPESDAYPRIPIKSLIVPAHEYRRGRVLTMLSTTNETAVRLKEPIEQQRDFVWTSFDVVDPVRR